MRKKSRSAKTNIKLFLEAQVSLPFEGLSRTTLKSAAVRICEMAELLGGSVSIILTDDAGIAEINKKYRNKPGPTDVISFSYRECPFPSVDEALEELGDVYISIERVRDQARRFDVPPAEELMRLLIHGILHLAGYDHVGSRDEAVKMRAREEEILPEIIRSLP